VRRPADSRLQWTWPDAVPCRKCVTISCRGPRRSSAGRYAALEAMSNARDEKQSHEREVFGEFLFSYAGPSSSLAATSCDPPEPDILCSAEPFKDSFFELGRLLNAESPRLHLEMIRRASLGTKPDLSKFGWPERDMLLQKLAKQYSSRRPVHLLLYWDCSNQLTMSGPPPFSAPFCIVGADLLTPLVVSRQHPFSGIYYFDRWSRRILWLWRGAT
jgi:hypothetical protein